MSSFLALTRPVHISPLLSRTIPRAGLTSARLNSSTSSPSPIDKSAPVSAAQTPAEGQTKPKKKTQAELDRELMEKLEERSGDGGSAGLELEDGQVPGGYRRNVKANIFRYI